MTTANLIKSLMIAATFAAVSAHAADSTIVIAMEEGRQVASYSVGNANCVHKDEQRRCTPAGK
jgi:hypothetical protein